MMILTIEDYRREFAAEGISVLLYALISDVVHRIAPAYPPTVYGPRSVWDQDALQEICQDFTLERLLEHGVLEYYLLAADNAEGLRRALGQVFRHFLIGRRQRSEYSNLFTRVRTLLTTNPQRFQRHGPERPIAQSLWGLAGWREKLIAQHRTEVLHAMFAVSLPPLVIYRADSTRHSHRINTENLVRLLEETLVAVDQWIRLELLMDGLRYRLHLLETSTISLDELVTAQEHNEHWTSVLTPLPENPDVVVPIQQLAEEIFDQLSDRQRQVLALRLTPPEPRLEQIAQQIGTSKSTVANDLVTIERIMRATEIDLEEAELLLAYLMELCESVAQCTGATTPDRWL